MLRKILRTFSVEPWSARSQPFPALIRTILSQNTTDVNSDRAFRRLSSKFRITPNGLANASTAEIAACIRVGGLYRSKSRTIKRVSKTIMRRYDGKLAKPLRKPFDQARSELTALPGVGPKTADILLAFVTGHKIIPVDTHVARVSARLDIVSRNARYETIRKRLEDVVAPNDRLRMHLALIRFGREVCRAPKPKCPVCPVNRDCPSSTV